MVLRVKKKINEGKLNLFFIIVVIVGFRKENVFVGSWIISLGVLDDLLGWDWVIFLMLFCLDSFFGG